MSPRYRPLAVRLAEKLRPTTNGCLEFVGCHSLSGYGRISDDGNLRAAHRVAWELANGPIPDGLWVLHRCDNPPCCNPDHLWLGDAKANTADMMRKRRHRSFSRTHCINGHEFTPENTRRRSNGRVVVRACRTCDVELCRAPRAARKQAAA